MYLLFPMPTLANLSLSFFEKSARPFILQIPTQEIVILPPLQSSAIFRHIFPQQGLPLSILRTIPNHGTHVLPSNWEEPSPLPINNTRNRTILNHNIDVRQVPMRKRIRPRSR